MAVKSSLQAEIVAIELDFCLTAIPRICSKSAMSVIILSRLPETEAHHGEKVSGVIFLTFLICRGSGTSLFSEVRFRRLSLSFGPRKSFSVSTRLPAKRSSSSSWINVRCSVSRATALFAVIFVFHGDALYFVINLLSSLIIASSISAEKLYLASGVGRSYTVLRPLPFSMSSDQTVSAMKKCNNC